MSFHSSDQSFDSSTTFQHIEKQGFETSSCQFTMVGKNEATPTSSSSSSISHLTSRQVFFYQFLMLAACCSLVHVDGWRHGHAPIAWSILYIFLHPPADWRWDWLVTPSMFHGFKVFSIAPWAQNDNTPNSHSSLLLNISTKGSSKFSRYYKK
jgi:hypothetical protein